MHKLTYSSWHNMIARCKNHPRYAGRGIKVCERWKVFSNFLADMGERPKGKTLDRFPNLNGDYEPGNARWATYSEQNKNREHTPPSDLSGKTYGFLTAVEMERREGSKKVHWRCRCVCGVEKLLPYSNLVYGHTKSCGCMSGALRKAAIGGNGYSRVAS